MQPTILIIDFGSQYTQLIARRVRELNVYCEIHPCTNMPTNFDNVKGVILSGSPFSVHQKDAPKPTLSHIVGKIPMLAVCYGAQLLAEINGGTVERSKIREYGRAAIKTISKDAVLFKGVKVKSQVWMSHGDTITKLPKGFEACASTTDVAIAAYQNTSKNIYAVQFHPEVTHSTDGSKMLLNFIKNVCKIKQTWTSENFADVTIANLKAQLGNDKVILALSGGVDSSVAGLLLHKAIGKNLHCIFVDNGLLRKDEYKTVLASYKNLGLNVKGVDAREIFYKALKGKSDPETKRKIIGKKFIDIFDVESKKITNAKWLGQGTIYPDIIESMTVNGPSATIKSHHNVGGLPAKMKLKVVEPLKALFKDEVRRVGRVLGLPENILGRHPFPGPGLGIRILGDITPEKVAILQEADAIFINALREYNLYDKVWQAGVMLLPVKSVGVMGDERTYENCVAIRAVSSVDGMTADWVHLPYEFLGHVSNEIINKVKGINRVVYDISSKPPATIEWE
jgi:GMP synthase (glutamine-hydrolysing)